MDINEISFHHFRDLWSELSQGVFPWIDDCLWKLDEKSTPLVVTPIWHALAGWREVRRLAR